MDIIDLIGLISVGFILVILAAIAISAYHPQLECSCTSFECPEPVKGTIYGYIEYQPHRCVWPICVEMECTIK